MPAHGPPPWNHHHVVQGERRSQCLKEPADNILYSLIFKALSASTRRLVVKCGPFSVKTMPSRVSARHLAQLSGFCEP